jgi:hypothetical protein
MAYSPFVVNTGTRRWKRNCLIWASEGQAFKIRGVGREHLAFLKKLRDSTNGEFKLNYVKSIADFNPKDEGS